MVQPRSTARAAGRCIHDDLKHDSESEDNGGAEREKDLRMTRSASVTVNTMTTIDRPINAPAMRLPACRNPALKVFIMFSGDQYCHRKRRDGLFGDTRRMR